MSRPTRNRLAVATFWVGCLVVGNVLPEAVRLPFVAGLLAAALASFAVSRRFFSGRRHLRKQRWVDALLDFQAFEAELSASRWKRALSFLAAGVYTRDAVALARNSVGAVHLENGMLELAEAAFRSALERDGGYAVPHLNLALVAARRGQPEAMEAALAQAARLGLTDAKAHAAVRGSLAAKA